jgi:hypothetical protein
MDVRKSTGGKLYRFFTDFGLKIVLALMKLDQACQNRAKFYRI